MLLLVLVLVLVLSMLVTRRSCTCNYKPPPSPFKLPFIGNLHQLITTNEPRAHRSLAALSRKHGPTLMLLRLGRIQTLVVSSPSVASQVMNTHDRIFSDRPSLAVPSALLYGCKDITFAPHGPYWRRMRKLAVLHLLSPPVVRTHATVRHEEVGFMIDKLRSRSGGVVNLSRDVFVPFAKDVIGRIVLGKCCREERWNYEIDEVVEESNVLLGSFYFGDFLPSWISWFMSSFVDTGLDRKLGATFDKLDPVLEEIVQGCIDRRKTTLDGVEINRTIVDVMLDLENDPSFDVPLTKDNIKALIEDIFGAGMDSTLIVLEWCMAELIRNPKAMRKLHQEIQSHVKDPKSAMVTEEDLVKASYLRAVIKETMRLHPPGPLLIPRRSMDHARVQGYNVPKGTMVIINFWAIGHDPNNWDSPNEFLPKRFLDTKSENNYDFRFFPFGAGRRVCPGCGLASSIVELALANLVYLFDWQLQSGCNIEDLDLEEAPGITSRMRTSLNVIAKTR